MGEARVIEATAQDALIEAGGLAALVVEPARGITAWSRGLERLAGCPGSAAVGRPLEAVVPTLAAATGLSEPLRPALAEGPRAGEARLPLLWSVRPFGPADDPAGAACVLSDPAEAREAAEVERRLRDFVEAASDWFWEMDAELRYSYLSDRYYEATGLPPGSRLGYRRGDFRLLGPDDGDWRQHLADLEARRPFRDFQFAYHDADGRRRVARVSGRPVFDAAGAFRGYRGVGRDITDLVRAEARIRHLAQHDPLTDLPNRTLFQDRLGHAIALARRRGTRVALLCVDLDDFKAINDGLGHAAGDLLLCTVARRMRESAREVDTIARLGGDEFAIVQPDLATAEGAVALAERLVGALAEPLDLLNERVVTTASIGIALCPDDGEDAEVLLRHADLALYRAKSLGRNGFQLYRPALGHEHASQRRLQDQLREAIETDTLRVDLCPEVDLVGGRPAGALVVPGWGTPETGAVAPAAILAVAERHGLGARLVRCLLRGACALAAGWRAAGHGSCRVDVELTADELERGSLAEEVAAIATAAGLTPAALGLVVHEPAARSTAARATLARLRAAGVRLTVAARGLALGALVGPDALPVDRVRLDATLVDEAGDGPALAAVVGFAHALGLSVVAEAGGPGCLDRLRRLGCDAAQTGPMQAAAFAPGVPPASRRAALRHRPALAAGAPPLAAAP
jgi:diguanylate cyclase (GGDEF)-like protein/PAS domain S-box-containing protein